MPSAQRKSFFGERNVAVDAVFARVDACKNGSFFGLKPRMSRPRATIAQEGSSVYAAGRSAKMAGLLEPLLPIESE
jgi:hypothetical protein